MSTLADYDVKDPTFVQDLLKSDSHVADVVRRLQRFGIPARQMPTQVRPDVHQMSQFSDDGDVFIGDQRVEIKQRHLSFTGKRDFPYATIIVDVCHAYDAADPKPFCYLLTNDDSTACLAVPCSTAPQWKRVQRWDNYKGRQRTFYECPIALCRELRQPFQKAA